MTSPASKSKFYFVHRKNSSQSSEDLDFSTEEPFVVSTPSERFIGTHDEVVENLPEGSSADQFGPRTVNMMGVIPETDEDESRQQWSTESRDRYRPDAPVGTLVKERVLPIKVDPKVYFANERTLLLWFHSALWLFAGASTIVKYANDDPMSQVYGVMLLPIALAFLSYAIWQHARRVKMIRVKDPGPYEDLFGPAILGIVLMTAIVAQFSLKLYEVWY